ncbi:translation initiation factor eIF-2B beta subunit [Basidiobolus meristosporus CBS 931.73]|uniref:Translation initiation factor eIF2B subunit beta n=1 Tax=Basidiobolus meristosporus CBS 931.73 TaxID=1314790 RepID=A0A1Y1YVJ8_9FUNG|nr:translation initiation factor eIF-2B beta subunit [Basidiobolus meristosporus CBS 931.73]|eukprot:ORY02083.1 translation initiation factor eIF-2B beta subunit [Basidiobolus meristosporus CBS 931.73]
MATQIAPKDLNAQIDHFIARLKRRQVVGSWQVSVETAILLRQVVSISRWNNVDVLIATVKSVGKRLVAAQPQELAIGNIVRRVLRLIREENSTFAEEDENSNFETNHTSGPRPAPQFASSSSMYNLLGDFQKEPVRFANHSTLKPEIIQGIQEIVEELENIYVNISAQALEHIHSNEIIMTCGKSKTVELFLKAAAKKRKFQVIVAETAPLYHGQEMARSLALAGIETTVIPDSAIFAVLSRVNKVILGTHAVLANGSLIAVAGSQTIATAAKHHSTPVVVCTGLYKLSPQFPYDPDTLNMCVSPNPVLQYEEGDLIDKIDLVNPYFDYIPPELVSLFITNVGGHPPSYLYRLLNENYDPEDALLEA